MFREFHGTVRFSVGSRYLVGNPVRCSYRYQVMLEGLTARKGFLPMHSHQRSLLLFNTSSMRTHDDHPIL